ncbi:recombinase family protein [Streptomyces sp. NPDC005151]
MNVLRAVIYVRLSRTTESSTSLARQEASCRAYAERQGWTVLRVFQDSNVSGGASPGERPAPQGPPPAARPRAQDRARPGP